MRDLLARFLRDTEGAVVADYVVLSAAIVGMGLSSVNSVRHGTGNLAGRIEAALTQARVALLCTETSGSLNGLCDGGSGSGGTGTGTGTGGGGGGPIGNDPDILTWETGDTKGDGDTIGDPTVEGDPKVPDYNRLQVLNEDIAKAYLDDLSRLSLEEIDRHTQELQGTFDEAVMMGDTYRLQASMDQLLLIHFDLSNRDGADLMAAMTQALYYDWEAIQRSVTP